MKMRNRDNNTLSTINPKDFIIHNVFDLVTGTYQIEMLRPVNKNGIYRNLIAPFSQKTHHVFSSLRFSISTWALRYKVSFWIFGVCLTYLFGVFLLPVSDPTGPPANITLSILWCLDVCMCIFWITYFYMCFSDQAIDNPFYRSPRYTLLRKTVPYAFADELKHYLNIVPSFDAIKQDILLEIWETIDLQEKVERAERKKDRLQYAENVPELEEASQELKNKQENLSNILKEEINILKYIYKEQREYEILSELGR